jgi:plasmid stabilization system protein ParE
VKLEISKRARRQIERIQAWWVEQRPAARSLFLDEMAAAERQLRSTPELGSIYTEHKTATVRRVLLPKTHHHLYYRYRADRDELIVLSVWGSPKERGPKL